MKRSDRLTHKDRTYRVQEFAELAGITVRALHHYDRLGLLRPRRTNAGYRLYRSVDLEQLEQIVALKFLGIPLKQIKALLDRDVLDLPKVLRRQRRVKPRSRAEKILAASTRNHSGSGGRSWWKPLPAAILK